MARDIIFWVVGYEPFKRRKDFEGPFDTKKEAKENCRPDGEVLQVNRKLFFGDNNFPRK